ncbi:MAG: hypothetical protein ACREWJ_04735, partial [Rhodoferax sp.]
MTTSRKDTAKSTAICQCVSSFGVVYNGKVGTILLVQAAVAGLQQIYAPDYQLIKAGVMLPDLVPNTLQQRKPDLQDEDAPERVRLMNAMNGRFG